MALAPLLVAVSPPPFAVPPRSSLPSGLLAEPSPTSVEVYDPVGRAQIMAERIPRTWTGTYRHYGKATVQRVELRLGQVTPLGQMVDLRGEISLDGVTAPVQGNINAKSNQLDLLVLGTTLAGALEPGGEFQGQQGLSLSGWIPDRLTSLGGRLQLTPGASPVQAGGVVRGLW
ncbi:MAG: hypothetical protein ACK5QW_04315 [Cyanobacteriota bacterium]